MNIKDEKIIESLKLAVAESVEGLAFTKYDSCQQITVVPELDEKTFLTNIEINLPFSASLFLICGGPFILNTIELITSEKIPDIDNPMIENTLKELLNTITEKFMIDLLAENTEFDFGTPNFFILDANTIVNKKNENDLVFEFNYNENNVYCVFKNL